MDGVSCARYFPSVVVGVGGICTSRRREEKKIRIHTMLPTGI